MNELIPDTIKLVVFDFDDTLVGTHQPIWNMHRHIAKKYYGIDLDDETLMKHWGQPINVLAGHYYQTDDAALGVQRILEENANFPKLKFEHTNAVLKKLRNSGKKVGIVTASHMNLIEMDFINVGMTKDMVDYIQTADDTNVHKPNPAVFEPLLKWANEYGITTDEILYIGDGMQDMIAANSAGLNFLGVTTGLVTPLDFDNNDANSIADLSIFL
jgi:HAD superfamily hydrolase (TIGR01549 family)